MNLFEAWETIFDNANSAGPFGDYGVLATFNEINLTPYLYDQPLENLRPNSPQQGVDDEF